MIISVHQPQYLPWLGYFDKIIKSDIFVFLDNVQYKKREFQNRNKIRAKNGWLWLTVAVITKGHFYQKISEVEIDNTQHWQKEHWETIKMYYHSSKYFENYKDFFEKLYNQEWTKLTDLNVTIIKYLIECLEIKTPLLFESELEISGEATERIINICKKLNADTYLSGIGGKDYLDEELMRKEKIRLIYQDFKHPVYLQGYTGFEPYMSAIDLLFNCGPESRNILCMKNTGA